MEEPDIGSAECDKQDSMRQVDEEIDQMSFKRKVGKRD